MTQKSNAENVESVYATNELELKIGDIVLDPSGHVSEVRSLGRRSAREVVKQWRLCSDGNYGLIWEAEDYERRITGA